MDLDTHCFTYGGCAIDWSGGNRMIQISIIIPVYNDTERLALCLARLAAQSVPRSSYEVIVVDNNSTTEIRSVCAEYGARYEFEARPGSYAARMQGVRVAKGAYLGFTDSDCVPAHDWIERATAHLERMPPRSFLGGRIDLFARCPDGPTAVELYELEFGFPQRRYVGEGWAATANMWTRASMFAQEGGFSIALQSGGDRDWGQRMTARGATGVYADDVIVAHPARATYAELRAKVRRIARGFAAASDVRVRTRFVVGHLLPPVTRFARIAIRPGLDARQKLAVASIVLLHRAWTLTDYVRALRDV